MPGEESWCQVIVIDLNFSKLSVIIERNILSSLVGFLDKPQDQITLSVQTALENVAKAAESMIENSDETTN